MPKMAEVFYDAINQVVDNRAVTQDKTISATISSVVSVEKGEYKVEYQSNLFSAFVITNADNTTYAVGDNVYVLVPQGDFAQRKIILTKIDKTKSSGESIQDLNFYTTIGRDICQIYEIDVNEKGICACPEDQQATLTGSALYSANFFDRENTTILPENLEKMDEELQFYSDAAEYLMIQAEFKTAFIATHSQGEYGIGLVAEIANPNYEEGGTEPEYVEEVWELGFASFTGSPYQYGEYTTQTAYFAVPKGTIKRLKKIDLMQDGNLLFDCVSTVGQSGGVVEKTTTDVKDHNNIFCKNISVFYAQKVNLNDGLYHTWISTPLGDRVSADQPTVNLVPHFYYKNVDYISDCEVRWFRRRSDIMKQTPTTQNVDAYNKVWTDYTGPGWEPIENILDDGFDKTWHKVNDDKTLTVYLDAVVWKWDYKCVCIYNQCEVVGTAEKQVVNKDSEYDLTLVDEVDGLLRYLYINDLNKNIKNADLAANASGTSLYRHWYGRWFVYLPDGSYTPIKYNDQYYIEGPIEISEYLKNSVVTFRVQCFDPYEFDPEDDGNYTSCAPVGEIEYTIVDNSENAVGYWTGDLTFNYDANGKAKNSLHLTDCRVALVLEFPEVDNNYAGGGYYGVRFYSPDGTQLYTCDMYESFASDGQAHDPENSMLRDMYMDDDFGVHFKVKEEYDGTLTSNTITAIVNYYTTRTQMEFECPITFTKDGEQGTQGTDWVAPIYPCNYQAKAANGSNEGTKLIADLFTAIKTKRGEDTEESRDVINSVSSTIADTTFSGKNGVRSPDYGTFSGAVQDAISKMATEKGAAYSALSGDELTALEAYYNYKTQEWFVVEPNSLVPAYMQREEVVNPLIIIKDTATSSWKQDPNNHVFFRPFVAKNGQRIEEMNPYEGYFYKIWWDVRFDNSYYKDTTSKSTHKISNTDAEQLINGSFLRLHHFGNHEMYKWETADAVERLYEWGNADKGTCCEWKQDGSTDTYVDEAPGLCGFNAYPSRQLIGTKSQSFEESYGAIEVRFADVQNKLTEIDFDRLGYIFFIKARIEIYKGGYDETIGGINPNKTDAELVATISSWHPVDVFFNPNNIEFKRDYFHTNWPSFVVYNSFGSNPVTNLSSDGSNELFAYYDEQSHVITDYYLYEYKMNMTAINYTPTLATLGEKKKTVNQYNDGANTIAKATVTCQTYNPVESLNWQYGMVGSLVTEPGTARNATGNDQWANGFFVRCQIFTLNTYGNSQVNGWDGESITAKDGTIFAPTVGAGYKDKATNSFSGVLMGVDSQWKKSDLTDYQKTIHGYDDADIAAHPYLAGLYGYQRGASTFGLMENGTAFFGRADRGGRIIIDGYHATMYGGANGWTDHPQHNDPMWNTMRLNFVDLYHPTDYEKAGGNVLGFDGKFFEDADFPDWLKKSWRTAYVVAPGQKPYWSLIKDEETLEKYTYEDLIANDVWYYSEEALSYTEEGTGTVPPICGYGWKPNRDESGYAESGDIFPTTVNFNVAINYWDNADDPNNVDDPSVWLVKDLRKWLTKDMGSSGSLERQYYCAQIEQDFAQNNLENLEAFKDEDKYTTDINYKQEYDNKHAELEEQVRWGYTEINSRIQALQDIRHETETPTHITDDWIATYIDYLIKALGQSATFSTYGTVDERRRAIAIEAFNCKSWEELLRNIRGENLADPSATRQYNINADYTWAVNNCKYTHQHSVFGPCRAATTPAIEIGQHVKGLRPGKLELSDYDAVMSNLDIPGDRNFMVTYDGTMWAMNGVFMGNVVGSNIVGGTIIGGEIEIGEVLDGASYWAIEESDDWTILYAPTQRKVPYPSGTAAIDMKNGVINAARINVYDGNINIGGFHIIGSETAGVDSDEKHHGHLIQFGESDFIGPTHIYGNIGIGPNCRPPDKRDSVFYKSNFGNLFQTFGRVGLGIVLPDRDKYPTVDPSLVEFHTFIAGNDGQMQNADGLNIQYKSPPSWGGHDPKILDLATGPSLQAYSMFGMNVQGLKDYTEEDPGGGGFGSIPGYWGHFWPMSFGLRMQYESWITADTPELDWPRRMGFQTMDNCVCFNTDSIVDGEGSDYFITNYFRVGTWSTECNTMFYRNGVLWERQLGDDFIPLPDTWPNSGSGEVIGYTGERSMTKWLKTGWLNSNSSKVALGVTSWNLNHIVIKSDMDHYNICRASFRVYGSTFTSDCRDGDTWYDDTDYFGCFLCIGDYQEFQPGIKNARHTCAMTASHGSVSLGVRADGYQATGWLGKHTHYSGVAGVDIDPENLGADGGIIGLNNYPPDPCGSKGVWVWTDANQIANNSIHIVCYMDVKECAAAHNNAEVLVGQQRIGIFHPSTVSIGAGGPGTAHSTNNRAMVFTGSSLSVNYAAEEQSGFYGRFA